MGRVIVIVILLAAAAGVLVLLVDTDEPSVVASISVAEALSGDTTGYRRAVFPAEITFPADHGAHPEYKTEWWYFTGNLRSESGRRFGYQFTIFRTALSPDDPIAGTSSWRSNQLYTAHFAVSDVETGRFYFSERSSRSAVDLAGAYSAPFRVWLEDWQIAQTGDVALESRVRASESDFAVDLNLVPGAAPIFHGIEGFSPKDEDSTNASYYYSFTRLLSEGRLAVGRDTFEVRGTTWMDHEWSTSALAPGQVGWDWFALRLSDGTDVMYFQVRDTTDSPPFVEGTVRNKEGAISRLSDESVRFRITDQWISPKTDVRYPSSWELEFPGLDMRLNIQPVMPNQELLLAVRYWEGAVSIQGSSGGREISGEGYVEMTGYEEQIDR